MAVVRGVVPPSNMCSVVDDAEEVEDGDAPPRICRYDGIHSCSGADIVLSLAALISWSPSMTLRLLVGASGADD